MRTSLLLGVVLALSVGSVSVAGAAWLETFDQFAEYPAAPLPAPWQGDAALGAHSGIGYDGTAGLRRPDSRWNWGYAGRPLGTTPQIGDALVARVYLDSGLNYRQVRLGLTVGETPTESGAFADGARAEIHVSNSTTDDTTGNFSYWSFTTRDAEGALLGQAKNGAPADAWYDVRLTLVEGHRVIAEFKHVEMNYWVPLGILPLPEGCQPQYVSVGSSRGGVMDDLGYLRAEGSTIP